MIRVSFFLFFRQVVHRLDDQKLDYQHQIKQGMIAFTALCSGQSFIQIKDKMLRADYQSPLSQARSRAL